MAEVLKETLKNATVAKTAKLCRLGTNKTSIISFSSFIDAVKLQNRGIVETYLIGEDGKSLDFVSRTGQEATKAQAFSAKGSVYVVHSVSETNGEKTDYLEIWSPRHGLVDVFNITLLKKHEQIVSGAQFSGMGGISLGGKDNAQVLYIAERKRPEKFSYFGKGETETGRNEFEKKDSWGEQFDDVTSTVPCILNTQNGEVTVLDFLDPNVSYSNPIWLSEGKIAVVGYKPQTYKLGLIYCNNRENEVFIVDLESKKVVSLSQNFPNKCFCAIIASPDASTIIALASDPLGAHMQFKSFVKIDTKSLEVSSSVLFAVESVPPHPWIDSSSFCFNMNDKASVKPMIMNITTMESKPICTESATSWSGSLKVLDFMDEKILLAKSSFSFPERLVLMNYGAQQLIECLLPHKTVYEYFVKKVESETKGYYMIGPKDQSKPRPGVLYLHGGPHVCFVDAFTAYVTFFVEMGFNMVLANYGGSLGYTAQSLTALAGNAGSADVLDCYNSLQSALNDTDWKCDKEKVAVTGGSHGGFLSLHLIGQYPNVFKACSVRNPVTNVGSMLGVTDIPDWCVYEAAAKCFSFDVIDTPEFYKTAWAKSPMNYVDKVVTPTQFHLGLKDKRVPTSQGCEYHKALMGFAKAETVLYEYPDDSHPLASPKAQANNILETLKWFSKHLEL